MRTGWGLPAALLVVLPASRAGAQAVTPNAALMNAAFAPAPLAAGPTLDPGRGLEVWRVDTVSAPASGGAVNAIRLSVDEMAYAPGGVITAGALAQSQLQPTVRAVDLDYDRGWPSALRLDAGPYALAVSPHAGFGVGPAGGSAEAGAMVQLGARLKGEVADRLDRLGLHEVSSDSFAGRGHWYLFAAASGRAVGLNMVGAFQRASWSADGASALVGDAQAGLGWRQGQVQAAVGYIRHQVRETAPIVTGPFNPNGYSDSMVAFSLSFRPR